MNGWWARIWSTPGWQKIGAFALDRSAARNTIVLGRDNDFRLIKLRSRGADVDVHRWTLALEDGMIVDLSVNRLPEGTESRPITITGRRLTGVAVEYRSRHDTWLGRLEVWAQR